MHTNLLIDNYTILKDCISIINQMKTPLFLIQINNLYTLIEETFKNNGKLIFIGNGGSASDSQHIVGEFVGIGFPAISLSSNISTITAIANDKNYNYIFSDQITKFSTSKNDILISLSTSGNSINILNTVIKANNLQIKTVGITGNQLNNKLHQLSNITIQIPSQNTQRIQEATLLIFHLIYDKMKRKINNEQSSIS